MKEQNYTLPVTITVDNDDIKRIISDILGAIEGYFENCYNSWRYINEAAKEAFIKQVVRDIYPELINSLLDNL